MGKDDINSGLTPYLVVRRVRKKHGQNPNETLSRVGMSAGGDGVRSM